jgi:hypothetical protein
MRRRAVLSAVGVSATASIAGCLDAVEAAIDEPMRLGRLVALNDDPDPHRFDLRVERGGETVHRSSHRIRGKSEGQIHGEPAECDWGTERGHYEVFARVDGGEWTGKPLAAVSDSWRNTIDCATAEVWYGEEVWIRLQANCDEFAGKEFEGACPIDESTGE